MTKLKKGLLSRKQTLELIAERIEAVAHIDTWNQFYDRYEHINCDIELPITELWNPNIIGSLKVWHSLHKIQNAPLQSTDRLKAQGLGGKMIIRESLTTALWAYDECDPFRCQIRVI